jgi:hypothetical protein
MGIQKHDHLVEGWVCIGPLHLPTPACRRTGWAMASIPTHP